MNKLGEHFVEAGLLTDSDLMRAADVSARTGARLASTIVRLGLSNEEAVARTLSTISGMPFLAGDALPLEALDLPGFNPRFMSRRSILPLRVEEDRLHVAVADPFDGEALAGVAFASGLTLSPAVATFSDIADRFGRMDSAGDRIDVAGDFADAASGDVERLLDSESEAPVIRTVQRLLTEAVNRRASDVHIEPMARYVAVRFRIDGRLIDSERLADTLGKPIASRIKVMAGLDIAESRLPQDGRLRLTVRGREVDVRVSTSPTAWGESIVMRLLGRSEVPLDLERLGLPPKALASLARALERPHGIILLTGPTGSGKTTTLYAAINRLRRPEVKILTVEDPVEVLLEGINQVQVRPEIDLSYATTLRAFLRQDPDILMIGEIRDQETAEIAMRAALTGHLVLSTLHTNSALGAFTRLTDIGVEPYLTAQTVIAAIAQRLIRALCPHCRAAHDPTADEERLFERTGIDLPAKVHAPVGCPHCQGTGFAGRVPLMEIVEPDDALRGRIREGRELDGHDHRSASESLFGHGLALVAAGVTSIAEVQRAAHLQ